MWKNILADENYFGGVDNGDGNDVCGIEGTYGKPH